MLGSSIDSAGERAFRTICHIKGCWGRHIGECCYKYGRWGVFI